MAPTLADQRRASFLAWMQEQETNAYRVAKLSGVPYTTLKSYERGPTRSLQGQAEAKIARAFNTTVEDIFGAAEMGEVGEIEPNNLRAWREHQRLTVEALAAGADTTSQIITDLEEGRITLSSKWLRRLSPVLRVRPGWILDFDPAELPRDVLEIFAQIPEENQDQALRVLETFRRTGTAN